MEQAKGYRRKKQERAGATPLFRLSAAQKVSWGRSRPFVPTCQVIQRNTQRSNGVRLTHSIEAWDTSTRVCINVLIEPEHRAHRKGKNGNANPKGAPLKLIRNPTIQVRLEEEVDLKLRNYVEYIGSTPAFVIAGPKGKWQRPLHPLFEIAAASGGHARRFH